MEPNKDENGNGITAMDLEPDEMSFDDSETGKFLYFMKQYTRFTYIVLKVHPQIHSFVQI